MHLEKINGNTYYIPASTNIGVFVYKDKYTLLIDTGSNNQQARKINDVLQESNLNPKYIVNTHNHIDHSGGNIYFQDNFPGCVIYASTEEKIFLENPLLFTLYLYGGNPLADLARHFEKSKKTYIDEVLTPGINKVNEEKFTIIPLAGHAQGQIAIATRDRVCFLGDSLFSREIIKKYSFPFLLNIAQQLKSYEIIKELEYDYYVVGHAPQVYNQEEVAQLLRFNQDNLNYYLELTLELLTQPKTREELLEEITILQELQLDLQEYYFSFSTLGAIITYLYDLDQLSYQIENGKLYFYKKI